MSIESAIWLNFSFIQLSEVKHFLSQGPLGWHTLSGDIPSEKHFLYAEHSYDFISNGKAACNALSWESNIQESIERELYLSLEVGIFFGKKNYAWLL